MKKIFILSLAVFLTFRLAAQQTNSISENRVDSLISRWMSDTHTPGVALAVLKNGIPLVIKTYGKSDLENAAPITAQSVFMIASLSKQFISFSILLLSQQSRLSLDDAAAKYITELPEPLKKITIRQLLSHTSGLARDPADYHPYIQQPVMDVIKSMYQVSLNAPPGDKMLYSNAGYFMLAEIINRVSGEPWDSFIRNKLFIPAGMKETRTASFTDIVPNRVEGYNYTGKGLVNTEKWIAVRPSGAFLSTINDLVKWDNFLDTTQLFSATNKALLWKPAKLNDGSISNYAFGWYAESFLNTRRIHHDGQYPGFRSDYERFQDEGLTVILLTNLDNNPLESLALKAAGIFDPKLAFPPFSVRVKVPSKPVLHDQKIPIEITARDEGQAANGTIVEMEIWDANGQAIYKQQAEGLDFAPGIDKSLHFSWSPQKAGQYTVNLGVYGPHWMFSYAWKMKLATINVQ